MELITLGGPVVVVLIALSIVGLAIALYKSLQYQKYSKTRLKSAEKAISLWVEGKVQPALEALKKNKSPFAEMLSNGVSWLSEERDEESKIREELTRQGQQIVTRVNSLNSFIELIAYLSPMLGLLGTVLGMIDVFFGLANEGGGADTGVLAGGIWEALLTTAVGLTIAIPFAIIHAMLESRATTIRRSMEDQLTRLFTTRLSAR
jgi:biopolymer transport protein ExbB